MDDTGRWKACDRYPVYSGKRMVCMLRSTQVVRLPERTEHRPHAYLTDGLRRLSPRPPLRRVSPSKQTARVHNDPALAACGVPIIIIILDKTYKPYSSKTRGCIVPTPRREHVCASTPSWTHLLSCPSLPAFVPTCDCF